jgi:hypothetical protein
MLLVDLAKTIERDYGKFSCIASFSSHAFSIALLRDPVSCHDQLKYFADEGMSAF